jgi:hypothetical protein
MRPPAHPCFALTLLGLVVATVGCSTIRPCRLHDPTGIFPHAHSPCAATLSQAAALDADGDERCVDAYYQVCAETWQEIGIPGSDTQCNYNTALKHLMQAACKYRRLDPMRGLKIIDGASTIIVPIDYEGFVWDDADFQQFHLPPTGYESLLDRSYGCAGIGQPLAVERCRRDRDPIEARFFPERSYFAATAVLSFCEGAAVLRFINPFANTTLIADGESQRLATDLTAPIAVTLNNAPRTYFAGFIEPSGGATRPRLNMLEPYQPGKIPVVLIHGLFSDPQSWADMINDLRATPGFLDRYQLWVFRYPTGQGFLQSATALRNELRAAVTMLAGKQADPALHRMVLVGHSMGGLIAKLQVTHSEHLIWDKLANRPLETIVTTEQARGFLAQNCFFDPNPDIDRVIFIASPHAGSLTSSGLIGRGSSLLVQPSEQQAAMHDQLIRDNPQTFNPLIEERMPTSIDMLEPKSPLLAVMRQMRLGCEVELHNIIGCSHPLSLDGPSDGVVSVRSATHPDCQSVIAFNAPHARVHRTVQASAEVLRILNVPACRVK